MIEKIFKFLFIRVMNSLYKIEINSVNTVVFLECTIYLNSYVDLLNRSHK